MKRVSSRTLYQVARACYNQAASALLFLYWSGVEPAAAGQHEADAPPALLSLHTGCVILTLLFFVSCSWLTFRQELAVLINLEGHKQSVLFHIY